MVAMIQQSQKSLYLGDEEWKVIADYPNYMISSKGRVKSLPRFAKGAVKYNIKGGLLKQTHSSHGYLIVTLFDNNGVSKWVQVHRLVAKAFLPNPENKPFIDHINTIRDDNRVENLRWATPRENQLNPISVVVKSAAAKKFVAEHPEVRKNASAKMKAFYSSGENRSILSRSLKKVWENPERLLKGVLGNPQRKTVLHFSKDGRLIGEYISTGQAALATGHCQSSISLYCRGKAKPKDKTIWKFKDET